MVSDLLDAHTKQSNEPLLHQVLAPEDIIGQISSYGVSPGMANIPRRAVIGSWTRSGLFKNHQDNTMAPIEIKLWTNLWKIQAPLKLKLFLWKSLSGALVVKERLQSRNILIDGTCSTCGDGWKQSAICSLYARMQKQRGSCLAFSTTIRLFT
ncbi:unnamed protein product, partial [Thlaspi arvense]